MIPFVSITIHHNLLLPGVIEYVLGGYFDV